MKTRNIGVPLVYILILLPIIFWVFRMPLTDRFFNFNSVLTSLGQIFGLLGMSMFVVTIILSSRLKFLESYFGGLNKIYFLHHILGGLSLIFLLFHPLILLFKYIQISLASAVEFLLPSGNLAVFYGIIALLMMILLLVFTFFIKLPYRTWKITHKFLAVAFFFAILHTFFVPSDVSLYLPLGIYMGILIFLAVVTILYRTIFGDAVIKRFSYVVENIKNLNDKVIEISMYPIEEKMNFVAGQYVFISFKGEGISRETHPFSISSGEMDSKLKITVKSLGKYTDRLKNLKRGSMASIEGPFGVFSYLKTKNKNQVWIAGGIGITPFLSIAKSLVGNDYKIDLYYCVNNKSEIIYNEELTNISIKYPNLRLVYICSDTDGYLDVEIITKNSGNILEKDFFLCGPPAMMKGLRSKLLANGVSNRNIHSEEFSF